MNSNGSSHLFRPNRRIPLAKDMASLRFLRE
jgi:hypothetical protein